MLVDLFAGREYLTTRRNIIALYSPDTKRLLRIEVLIMTGSELRRSINFLGCDGDEFVLLEGMLLVAARYRASAHCFQSSCSEVEELENVTM